MIVVVVFMLWIMFLGSSLQVGRPCMGHSALDMVTAGGFGKVMFKIHGQYIIKRTKQIHTIPASIIPFLYLFLL